MFGSTFLIAIFGFIIVIGPLIVVHELGHYLVGRWFGVGVESFSIGMGREVAGWTDRHGTRWRISALPIGGYVKFAGDMGVASTPDPAWLRLPPEERARTFQAKPLWQRFLIVAAGPFTNFALAFIIFAMFFAVYGAVRTPPVAAAIAPGSPAAAAGFRPGDRVVAIEGRAISSFEDILEYMRSHGPGPTSVEIEREGRQLTLQPTTRAIEENDALGQKSTRAQLGLAAGTTELVKIPVTQVPLEALIAVRNSIRRTADVLGQIITGERSAKELGGPLKIAQISGKVVSFGPLPIVEFMALISINLGFMNLLPIPMLDGGHLFFYLLQGIRGRPLPERAQEWAFRSGLVLLLSFMLFVTINDLGSFGLWQKLARLIG